MAFMPAREEFQRQLGRHISQQERFGHRFRAMFGR
jgi:hypothetical protein